MCITSLSQCILTFTREGYQPEKCFKSSIFHGHDIQPCRREVIYIIRFVYSTIIIIITWHTIFIVPWKWICQSPGVLRHTTLIYYYVCNYVNNCIFLSQYYVVEYLQVIETSYCYYSMFFCSLNLRCLFNLFKQLAQFNIKKFLPRARIRTY